LAEIVANSVLPSYKEALTVITEDGETLVAELAKPEGKNPVATLVLVHPLPTHGGSSDSHLYKKMAWRLPELSNLAILRFNTRGTTSSLGTSSGAFDSSNKEGLDLKAIVEKAVHLTNQPPWVIGWSFGTDVILRNARQLNIAGVILLSPPLRYTKEEELISWSDFDKPMYALIPELDDYLKPVEAKIRFSNLPNLNLVPIAGAKHLWIGETQVRVVLNSITKFITGLNQDLPVEYSGPMTRHNDLAKN
jgi:alpha/beta superfamily hydrolase